MSNGNFDIYIYETDEQIYSTLKDICFRYLMQKNYESEIYEYTEENYPSAAAMFIIAYNDKTEEISQKIRFRNSGNYIVVRINDLGELKKVVSPKICPSGFMVRPCVREEVEAVLDVIYADHMRCCSDAQSLGNFVFKQKAKEYVIPYEKIILFESRNKKIAVRTETQEFEFYTTLENIAANAPECFIKIHKSFIINLSRVNSVDYGNMIVEFDDGSFAYISRTYKNELKEKMSSREGRP